MAVRITAKQLVREAGSRDGGSFAGGTEVALSTGMPSFLHEALVAMLREQPEFTRRLLRDQGVAVPARPRFRSASEDKTQIKPVEFRADAVLLLRKRKPVLGVIAEVQLAIKAKKRRAWPNYLTGFHARFGCPCILLVLTTSRSVARWAAKPILISPGWVLRPIVIGPDQVPIVTDPKQARRSPELAVLSAIVHGKGNPKTAIDIALAVRKAISKLDENTQALYLDLAESCLGPAARKVFEKMNLANYQFRGVSYKQGKKEGLLKGKKEGLLEGERKALLLLLRTKFGEVPKRVQTRLQQGTEVELTRWTKRVLTADSLADVFKGRTE